MNCDGQSSSNRWYDNWQYSTSATSFEIILELPAVIEGGEYLLNHLSMMLDKQLMTDVVFIVKGQRVGAHLAILASASPVFVSMFEGKLKRGTKKFVEIKDTSMPVLKQVLKFIYTRSVVNKDNPEMAEPLFLAADKYQIDALKTQCEDCWSSHLKIDNVVKNRMSIRRRSCSRLAWNLSPQVNGKCGTETSGIICWTAIHICSLLRAI